MPLVPVDSLPYEYELIEHPQTRWFLDESYNLYIVPPISYNDEIHGTDEAIIEKLRMFCFLYDRTPNETDGENMGLLYVEHKYRHYFAEDGYTYKR